MIASRLGGAGTRLRASGLLTLSLSLGVSFASYVLAYDQVDVGAIISTHKVVMMLVEILIAARI